MWWPWKGPFVVCVTGPKRLFWSHSTVAAVVYHSDLATRRRLRFGDWGMLILQHIHGSCRRPRWHGGDILDMIPYSLQHLSNNYYYFLLVGPRTRHSATARLRLTFEMLYNVRRNWPRVISSVLFMKSSVPLTPNPSARRNNSRMSSSNCSSDT